MLARRRFFEEMSTLLDRKVIVVTRDNHRYLGELVGYDPTSLSVCLREAKDKAGKIIHRIFIHGNTIASVVPTEKPFDLNALADRISNVFPNMVKVLEKAGVIVVMDKIRVTEKGIVEGTGPAAERIKKVYEKFLEETRA